MQIFLSLPIDRIFLAKNPTIYGKTGDFCPPGTPCRGENQAQGRGKRGACQAILLDKPAVSCLVCRGPGKSREAGTGGKYGNITADYVAFYVSKAT